MVHHEEAGHRGVAFVAQLNVQPLGLLVVPCEGAAQSHVRSRRRRLPLGEFGQVGWLLRRRCVHHHPHPRRERQAFGHLRNRRGAACGFQSARKRRHQQAEASQQQAAKASVHQQMSQLGIAVDPEGGGSFSVPRMIRLTAAYLCPASAAPTPCRGSAVLPGRARLSAGEKAPSRPPTCALRAPLFSAGRCRARR